jgi:hypothetical protein
LKKAVSIMSIQPIPHAFVLTCAVALTAAFAAPDAPGAEPDEPAPCFLDGSRVASVSPYYGKQALGRAVLRPLLGAELELVPAIGLSSQQLEAHLEQLLRAPRRQPLPACLTDVGHVHIESDPLGGAASVQLIARDPDDAEQVFQRVQRLVNE